MPLYEYKCKECGDIFEQLVNRTESDETPKCTACGSKETERVPFSRFAVAVASSRPAGVMEECAHCKEGDGCDNPKQCFMNN